MILNAENHLPEQIHSRLQNLFMKNEYKNAADRWSPSA